MIFSLMLSWICFNAGLTTTFVGLFLGTFVNSTFSGIIAAIIIPSLSEFLTLFHWFFASFIVSMWITKFIDKCNNVKNMCNPIQEIRSILDIYKHLDEHLGLYTAICFGIFQINWIMITYLGLIIHFNNFSASATTVFGLGALITSLSGVSLTLFYNKKHPFLSFALD